jgi:Cof subfamily protein (haloacid dehalogenase superfamily)
MQKKLILLDIDGTLFDNRNRRVPESAIQAVKEASQTIKIAIATGRAKFMLSSIAPVLPYAEYLIAINGQYIEEKSKVIYQNPIPIDVILPLLKDLEEAGIAYGFEGSDQEAISRIDDKVISSFDALSLNLPPIGKEFYQNHQIYQMWCFTTPDTVRIIAEKNPYFQFIRWMDVGFDILPKEASKGLGMKHLLEYLNISAEETVAIGDGDNDYELIRDAGIGIAMGNATEKIKSVADYITDDVSNDGFAKALKHYKIIA